MLIEMLWLLAALIGLATLLWSIFVKRLDKEDDPPSDTELNAW